VVDRVTFQESAHRREQMTTKKALITAVQRLSVTVATRWDILPENVLVNEVILSLYNLNTFINFYGKNRFLAKGKD
jgi:hypothetical protein